jgi:predicted nuclease of predicted toxin-antitoxin system
MGLAQSTVAFLRDQGLQQLEDIEIVQKARAESRVILTHDLDFGRIVALGGTRVPSVITFRLSDMRPGQVYQRLRSVLERFAQQLELGALVSVTDSGIRVRSLPISD